MPLGVSFLYANAAHPVLPGLQAAFPPIEQKSTAIWRKLTAI
jgi:hypothetical protein